MTALSTTHQHSAQADSAINPHECGTESSNPALQAGMSGQCIVCFAKDWNEDPTSNNHVMVELARHNRVLWLNSVATRSPNLAAGRDLAKIFRKIARFLGGARREADNLWVFTPLVLPLPHSRWAAAINLRILQFTLWFLRRRLGFGPFQLWTFLPTITEYLGRLGESMIVYYCVDDWSKLNYVDGARVAEAERELCRKADVVFAVAQSLVDDRLEYNPQTYLSRHGVDHALFAKALEPSTPVPPDIAALPGPVLGFYGTLQDWVDLDLVSFLARRHPEWSIALIGKPMVDLSRIAGLSNVHLLGRKPHGDLPAYCRGFSVGIIPYVVNERILTVNPIKLREYLSAGLPVVSVAIPEVLTYGRWCRTARTYEEFEQGVQEELAGNTPELARRRSGAMRSETWEQRVSRVGTQVMSVKAKRCQTH